MTSDPNDHDQLKHALAEREKELDALYRLAALFSRPVDDVRAAIRETAEILRSSMEHPDAVGITIEAEGRREVAGAPAPVDGYTARRTYDVDKQIAIYVTCAEPPGIDEREQHLVSSTAALLADLLERKHMDQVLRDSTRSLERQTSELERKNVALREVLSQIEHEKRALLRDARAHVDTYVRPYLHEIGEHDSADPFIRSRVDRIQATLATLFTADDRRLAELAHRLTPREVEICGLIRGGLTTKEISSYLHISETTVERHRNTIRRKLKLNGSSVNLTTYLRSAT
jgi:DNA-binding CsgD family transcriptional regulator